MPNLININPEATIWFVPAAATQAEDAIFEVDGLGAGAGQQSAQHALGVAAHSRLYEWRAFVQFATAPVFGESINIYLKTAGSSASATIHPDNDDGTGDLAVSAIQKLDNLQYLGSIIVDQETLGIEMVASGFIEISARAVQVVFWNASVDALTTDVNENGFMLTPVPDEIQ